MLFFNGKPLDMRRQHRHQRRQHRNQRRQHRNQRGQHGNQNRQHLIMYITEKMKALLGRVFCFYIFDHIYMTILGKRLARNTLIETGLF